MEKQYLADFHFHTECSPDSKESLARHIASARGRGMNALCVTDHWDLVDDAPTLSPDLLGWRRIFDETISTLSEEVRGEMSLGFGVEVGDGYLNPELVAGILKESDLDFVLGSVHAIHVNGGTSIYYGMGDCETLEEQRDFLKEYFVTLEMQTRYPYFDSLSHITYPFRYLKAGCPLVVDDFLEELTATFENLLKHDLCMEVNTTQGKTLEIWKPVLKRYREMGGRLITLGSDAHRCEDSALGIVEAVGLLRSMGFDFYSVFQGRVRRDVPIL